MLAARLAFCAALCCVAISSSPAFAAEPTAADRETARQKGDEGLKLFGAEKFDEAYEKFRIAYDAVPAPSLKLYMARCQRKRGKLIEARDLYEQIVLEVLPKDPPMAYLQAQNEAKTELDALRKRIPIVQIVTSGVPEESVRAAVDGKAAPIRDERIELNPGEHTVDVMSTRAKAPQRRSLLLTEGSSERLLFQLVPAPGEPLVVTPPPGPVVRPKKTDAASAVPGIAVLGMGAINLGVGGIMGILAQAKVDDLKAKCENNVCLPQDEPTADAARTMGNIATVNLIVGALGVVGGTTLLLIRGNSTQDPKVGGNRSSVSMILGAGSLGVKGTF